MTTMTNYILGSSLIIMAILLVRKILGDKCDPNIRYFLWIFVALRIMIPFEFALEIPESVLPAQGVMFSGEETDNLAEKSRNTGGTTAADKIAAGQNSGQITQSAVNQSEEKQSPVSAENMLAEALPENLPEEEVPAIEGGRSMSEILKKAAAAIWVSGSILMVGYVTVMNMRAFAGVRKRRICRLKEKLDIYEVEDSNCLVGIIRPCIYVSPQVLQDEEKYKYVIMHEMEHYRAKDNLWVLLRTMCLIVQWFNPLVWVAYMVSQEDCELACDYRVLRRLNQTQRESYAETLLHVFSDNISRKTVFTAEMGDDKRIMKKRLEDICSRKKGKRAADVAVLAAALIVVSVSFVSCSVQPVHEKEADSDAQSVSDAVMKEPEIFRYYDTGITFVYPSAWIARDTRGEDGGAVSLQDAQGNVLFSLERGESWRMDLTTTEDEYMTMMSEKYENLSDLKLTQTQIDGCQTNQITFSYENAGKTYVMSKYQTICGYVFYEFKCTYPAEKEEYEEQLTEVMESVRFAANTDGESQQENAGETTAFSGAVVSDSVDNVADISMYEDGIYVFDGVTFGTDIVALREQYVDVGLTGLRQGVWEEESIYSRSFYSDLLEQEVTAKYYFDSSGFIKGIYEIEVDKAQRDAVYERLQPYFEKAAEVSGKNNAPFNGKWNGFVNNNSCWFRYIDGEGSVLWLSKYEKESAEVLELQVYKGTDWQNSESYGGFPADAEIVWNAENSDTPSQDPELEYIHVYFMEFGKDMVVVDPYEFRDLPHEDDINETAERITYNIAPNCRIWGIMTPADFAEISYEQLVQSQMDANHEYPWLRWVVGINDAGEIAHMIQAYMP